MKMYIPGIIALLVIASGATTAQNFRSISSRYMSAPARQQTVANITTERPATDTRIAHSTDVDMEPRQPVQQATLVANTLSASNINSTPGRIAPGYSGRSAPSSYANDVRSRPNEPPYVPTGMSDKNSYIDPGSGQVGARYNKAYGRYFYYCSSTNNNTSRRPIACNAVPCEPWQLKTWRQPDRMVLQWLPGGSHPLAYFPNLQSLYDKNNAAQLAPDNTSRHSNSARFFSFDGFVVYEKDTLDGIVTITGNSVSLERPAALEGRHIYTADLKDPQLSAIVVSKGIKELRLVRLQPGDKHLYRLVHYGKLTVYDRSYDFLTATNIKNKLECTSSPGTFSTLKSKRDLVNAMNASYGLNLDANEISTTELHYLLNSLD